MMMVRFGDDDGSAAASLNVTSHLHSRRRRKQSDTECADTGHPTEKHMRLTTETVSHDEAEHKDHAVGGNDLVSESHARALEQEKLSRCSCMRGVNTQLGDCGCVLAPATDNKNGMPSKKIGSDDVDGNINRYGEESADLFHIVPLHPYGVRPEGNALLDGAARRVQSTTMGLFARLPHDVVLQVVGLLSPTDLTRLERTSTSMRAFAAHEPVWREALIRQTKGHLSCWKGSWKATMASHYRVSAYQAADSRDCAMSDQLGSGEPKRRQPLFSDALFLPLQLASLPLSRFVPGPFINEPNLPTCEGSNTASMRSARLHRSPFRTIQRESMDTLTQETFLRRFAISSVPCILLESPAAHHKNDAGTELPRWTIEDLQRLYPTRRIRAEALTMSMSTYSSYSQTCRIWERQRALWLPDESPFYLFDPALARTMQKQGLFVVPALFREIDQQFDQHARNEGGASPTPADETTTTREQQSKGTMKQSWDLFSLLHDRRPDHAWIIAGPKRSGSGWHVDPNHTSAYNTVLSGRKLWMLLPPHITPPGVFISRDGATVTAPLSIAEWLTDFWKACVQKHGCKGDNTLIVDVCGPGETVYVPAGWKHLVVNLEDSVAFTQNFVSPAELPAVLDFLKNRPAQISGFRTPRRRSLATPKHFDGDDYVDAEYNSGDESDPELDELPDDGLAEKSKLYALFVERLSAFDGALCEQGISAMREREKARQVVEHRRAPANWWSTLKSTSSVSSTGATTQTDSASYGLAPSEEELDDVPW